MERSAEEAWPHFRGWRVNYEALAYRLAYELDVVPAHWSGPRRGDLPPIATRRPANRTPEDPNGSRPGPRAVAAAAASRRRAGGGSVDATEPLSGDGGAKAESRGGAG